MRRFAIYSVEFFSNLSGSRLGSFTSELLVDFLVKLCIPVLVCEPIQRRTPFMAPAALKLWFELR